MIPTRERPLAGRRVLLTRPAGTERLAARLSELGAEVVTRPTIALVPPTDLAPVLRAVEALASYAWLLFTSPQGVRSFAGQVAASGRDPAAIGARVAAIGPGTARELRMAGLTVELVAPDSRSEGLLAALLPRLAPGARVLLVRPEIARPLLAAELRGAGIALDDVAFYRNAATPRAAVAAEEILQGRFDVVVFTSPSTLERLLEAGGPRRAELVAALGRTRIVAIGPVTAGAVRAAGLGVGAVARSPGEDGIVEAIRSLFPL